MTDSAQSYPWWSGDHRLAGTTRLLLGFVVGALFALFPMYYFYIGREAGLRGGSAQDAASGSPGDAYRAFGEAGAVGGPQPFASRMTYELSHLPEERPAAPAKAPAAIAIAPTPAARPAAVPPSVPPVALPESATERVANARPISAIPPEPRDRTREIEKEAQKPEYRDPGRTAKAPPLAPVGKVFEGREVELTPKPKLPDTPTRPIVAGASDSRAEIAAERTKRSADTPQARAAPQAGDPVRKAAEGAAPALIPGAQVAGVTPITRPPAPVPRIDAAQPKLIVVETKAAASAPEAPASGEDVQSRLEATREWLAAAPAATHTIQLMGANSEEQLKAHLKTLSKVLEPTKIYAFRTMAQGKPSITVVYGAYADRSAAARALEKLPPTVTANRPVLRTVNGIRTEMKQHKIDG